MVPISSQSTEPDVADHILLDRSHCSPEASGGQNIGIGATLLNPDRQHAADVCVGLRERHARLQSRDPDVGMDVVGKEIGALESLRQDDGRFGVQEAERLRHDADHVAWP